MTGQPRVTPTGPSVGADTDRIVFIGTATTLIQARAMPRGDAEVRVTSLPGQHAPRPLGYVVPPVMGSLLDFSRDGQRLLRLYITGDTLMHDGIRDIAERFGDIDLCLIHLGGT